MFQAGLRRSEKPEEKRKVYTGLHKVKRFNGSLCQKRKSRLVSDQEYIRTGSNYYKNYGSVERPYTYQKQDCTDKYCSPTTVLEGSAG